MLIFMKIRIKNETYCPYLTLIPSLPVTDPIAANDIIKERQLQNHSPKIINIFEDSENYISEFINIPQNTGNITYLNFFIIHVNYKNDNYNLKTNS